MDFAECSLCGQTIIQWPFEDGWNHHAVDETKPINWKLTDEKGCFSKPVPAEERFYARMAV